MIMFEVRIGNKSKDSLHLWIVLRFQKGLIFEDRWTFCGVNCYDERNPLIFLTIVQILYFSCDYLTKTVQHCLDLWALWLNSKTQNMSTTSSFKCDTIATNVVKLTCLMFVCMLRLLKLACTFLCPWFAN